jgi:hypothetical protein
VGRSWSCSGFLFSVAIAVGYGALGIMGWFVHTLFADHEFRIPLAPADNAFHVLLAAGAVVALAASSYTRRS